MEGKLVDLKDTIAGMQSDDYKERFVAEYHQVRTRKAKLDAFIARIKTAKEKGDPEPRHDCPVWVLESQADAMAKYQAVLEIRANDYEGINLSAKNDRMTADDFAEAIKARKGNILGRKVSEILNEVDFAKGDAIFILRVRYKSEDGNIVELPERLDNYRRLRKFGLLDYRIRSISKDDVNAKVWLVSAERDGGTDSVPEDWLK